MQHCVHCMICYQRIGHHRMGLNYNILLGIQMGSKSALLNTSNFCTSSLPNLSATVDIVFSSFWIIVNCATNFTCTKYSDIFHITVFYPLPLFVMNFFRDLLLRIQVPLVFQYTNFYLYSIAY